MIAYIVSGLFMISAILAPLHLARNLVRGRPTTSGRDLEKHERLILFAALIAGLGYGVFISWLAYSHEVGPWAALIARDGSGIKMDGFSLSGVQDIFFVLQGGLTYIGIHYLSLGYWLPGAYELFYGENHLPGLFLPGWLGLWFSWSMIHSSAAGGAGATGFRRYLVMDVLLTLYASMALVCVIPPLILVGGLMAIIALVVIGTLYMLAFMLRGGRMPH